MEQQKSIGSFWSRTASTGKQYFSGILEINGVKTNVVLFSNNKKGNDKAPDYRMFESLKKENAQAPKSPQNSSTPQTQEQVNLIDIPF